MREIAGVWANWEDDGLTHYIEVTKGWYYPCCGLESLLQMDVVDIEKNDFATCLLCIVELLTCP